MLSVSSEPLEQRSDNKGSLEKCVTKEIGLGNSVSHIPDGLDDALNKNRNQISRVFRSTPRTADRSKRKIRSVLDADFGLDCVLFISAFADNTLI